MSTYTTYVVCAQCEARNPIPEDQAGETITGWSCGAQSTATNDRIRVENRIDGERTAEQSSILEELKAIRKNIEDMNSSIGWILVMLFFVSIFGTCTNIGS